MSTAGSSKARKYLVW